MCCFESSLFEIQKTELSVQTGGLGAAWSLFGAFHRTFVLRSELFGQNKETSQNNTRPQFGIQVKVRTLDS